MGNGLKRVAAICGGIKVISVRGKTVQYNAKGEKVSPKDTNQGQKTERNKFSDGIAEKVYGSIAKSGKYSVACSIRDSLKQMIAHKLEKEGWVKQ